MRIDKRPTLDVSEVQSREDHVWPHCVLGYAAGRKEIVLCYAGQGGDAKPTPPSSSHSCLLIPESGPPPGPNNTSPAKGSTLEVFIHQQISDEFSIHPSIHPIRL